jgi:pyridoxal phosphate enzyme (YggS family)
MSAPEEAELHRRFASVLARMRKAGQRAPEPGIFPAKEAAPRLVAVSKGQEPEKLAAIAKIWKVLAPELPVTFAENYMQEGLSKQEALACLLPGEEFADIRWHFCGHLQSNKARLLTGRFELLHTLDSLSLARNLHKILQATSGDKTAACFMAQKTLVQINIGAEKQKSGVLPDEAEGFIRELTVFPEISVLGLMCLPPLSCRAEDSRTFFSALRQLRGSLEQKIGLALPLLSMGMSQDFEIALEEGANLIRVGTDIFGARRKY